MAQRSRFGSVRKLPSGRFQVRFTVPGTERTITAPITYETKTDAETWLAMQRADLARGTWRPAPVRALTFREYAERWLAQRDLRPRTVAHYRKILDRFILPGLGYLALAKISPEIVRTWMARLTTGPTYKSHAYRLLSAIMRTAVDHNR